MKRLVALSLFGLLGLGCTTASVNSNTTNTTATATANLNTSIEAFGETLETESDDIVLKDKFAEEIQTVVESNYYYPMQDYTANRTHKIFAQFIPESANDRFTGYHTGDDVEVVDVNAEVAVYALASGVVAKKQTVSGYGGVVIIEFVDKDTVYHALYGHIDLASVKLEVGDNVTAGEELGVLGDHESAETDGERKHLHFGIYEYNGTELYAGYVQNRADLTAWQDPLLFLQSRYVAAPDQTVEDTVSDTLKKAINSAQN